MQENDACQDAGGLLICPAKDKKISRAVQSGLMVGELKCAKIFLAHEGVSDSDGG